VLITFDLSCSHKYWFVHLFDNMTEGASADLL
jgi:hypothetical protein